MLPLAVVLGGLFGLVKSKALEWKSYTPKDGDGSNYISTAASFQASGGHELRVVRFSRGHPTAHIFLLAPAPGQSSRYWEGELTALKKLYNNDYVIYALDLRGTLHASPFTDTRDESWTRTKIDNDFTSKDGKLSLSELTIEGMARDLEEIIERVKSEASFKGTLHLHARSFGGLVAVEALERKSKEYQSILFESFLLPKTWSNVQNDSSFLLLCAQDPYCRRQFGGVDPMQLRSALVTLGSPDFNQCSMTLIEALKAETSTKLPLDASSWMRIHEFLMPFLYGRINTDEYHSAMIVLPFLSSTYVCPNAESFKKEVLPVMINAVKDKNFPRIEPFDDRDVDVNRFVNAWFMIKEVYDMGYDKQHSCQSPIPLGLASPCILYKYYREKYYKPLKDVIHRHTKDYYGIKEASSTRLYFVGGALDLLTPLVTTEEFFQKSNGKDKRLIKFSNLGHHPLSKGICSEELGSEFLGRGSVEVTNLCINTANGEKVNWMLPKATLIPAGRWWSGDSVDPVSKSPLSPKHSLSSANNLSIGHYLVVAFGVSAVSAVVGHVLWILWRKPKRLEEEM